MFDGKPSGLKSRNRGSVGRLWSSRNKSLPPNQEFDVVKKVDHSVEGNFGEVLLPAVCSFCHDLGFAQILTMLLEFLFSLLCSLTWIPLR